MRGGCLQHGTFDLCVPSDTFLCSLTDTSPRADGRQHHFLALGSPNSKLSATCSTHSPQVAVDISTMDYGFEDFLADGSVALDPLFGFNASPMDIERDFQF